MKESMSSSNDLFRQKEIFKIIILIWMDMDLGIHTLRSTITRKYKEKG